MYSLKTRVDYVLKHNQQLHKLFRSILNPIIKTLGIFIPMNKKMILFTGQGGKYNDSSRAIYEYLITNNNFKGYKFVWALKDPESEKIPGPAIKIKIDTLKYFITSLRAKYWVACVNIERSLKYKKKNCRYLNTWHGVAFKCIGNGANGRKDFDFSHINLFCYESDYQKEIFMRDFRVKESALIPTGLPRNDDLYKTTPEKILSLKKKLGLPLDKKIILYAPTWRDTADKGASYSIKPPVDFTKWEKALKNDYVLLLRTHSYTTNILGVAFNDFCRNFSDYPSINDLFMVSDILISDYSASIADFSILERPVICFAYDYEEYKSTRGLNLDFRTSMPNGIFETEDDVINHIMNMDIEKEGRKTKEMIKDRLTYIGGDATRLCAEALFPSKDSNS